MPYEPVLGVQLYTVREAARTDLSAALREIARIGYPAVEPHDILSDPTGLGELLDRHQLHAPAAHAPMLGERQEEILSAARALDIGTIIVPYAPPERFSSSAGIARLATELNRAAARAGESGVRLGYHNHHFELQHRIDGRPALEYLANLLDPEVVLEVDIYWAAVAEPDVPALLERLGERVRFLHIKDGPLELDAPHAAVGAGAMPVWAVLDAARHVEAGFVELDECDGDVFTALAESYRYLRTEPEGSVAR